MSKNPNQTVKRETVSAARSKHGTMKLIEKERKCREIIGKNEKRKGEGKG